MCQTYKETDKAESCKCGNPLPGGESIECWECMEAVRIEIEVNRFFGSEYELSKALGESTDSIHLSTDELNAWNRAWEEMQKELE